MNLDRLIKSVPVYGRLQLLLDYGTEVMNVNMKPKTDEDGVVRPILPEDIPPIGGFTRYEILHMGICNMTAEAEVALIPEVEPETVRTTPYICVSLDTRVIEDDPDA